MDVLSVVGVILGFVAILGGNLLEGGHLASLYNGPAFVIVVGGTVASAMVQTPLAVFKRALHMFKWIFYPPTQDARLVIEKIVNWSQISRREGLLGLEQSAEVESEPFARKGLQLLVDGAEPESIRSVLETELYVAEYRALAAVKVYEAMGGYAPTIGIIGAVMGLIHVMGNLADPSMLGSGIATAFVATIYGVGFANLFFLPVANKLKARVHGVTQFKELMIEGVIAISEGENPRTIEMKLLGFVQDEPLTLDAITK